MPPPKPIPKFTGLTPEAAKIVEQVTAGFLPQGLDDAKIKQIAEENKLTCLNKSNGEDGKQDENKVKLENTNHYFFKN